MARVLGRIDLTNASQLAYEALKEGITSHQFQPGEQLIVKNLAEQMGLSTTPVNQAIARLAEEELVKIVPRRGTFVATMGPERLRHLYEAREAIEVYAARLAVGNITEEDIQELQRILDDWGRELQHVHDGDESAAAMTLFEKDSQFHRRLVALSGNTYLSDIFAKIDAQLWAFARMKHRKLYVRVQHIAAQGHERILRALRSREEVAVAQAVRDHIWEIYALNPEVAGPPPAQTQNPFTIPQSHLLK
ncbi:MAG: GntR family transcriptional regulator [Chloroflexi bacterium]|nr:GntR family transcriptional regulator [Chloroflexota bacterium]